MPSPQYRGASEGQNTVSSVAGVRSPRLHYVDYLRLLLTALVILHHTAITYGAPGGWYYRENPDNGIVTDVILTLFVATNQAFFMGFFFLIAGYFTPGAYDRKGGRAFLRDRLLRLGIPLVVYIVCIDPAMGYALRTVVWGHSGSLLDVYREGAAELRLGVGPLWFVEILLIFSATYAVVRRLRRRSGGAPQAGGDGRVPRFTSLALLAVGLGAVSFAVRVFMPAGGSLPFPHIQPPYATQYIVMFPLGALAYRRGWLSAIPDSYRRGAAWAVGALFVLFFVLFGVGQAMGWPIDIYMGGWHWQAFAATLWEQSMGVAMIVLLLTTFRARLNRPSKAGARLSASAYAAYILHAPVLLGVSLACRAVDAPGLAKFAGVGFVTLVATFAVSDAIRRLPGARSIV